MRHARPRLLAVAAVALLLAACGSSLAPPAALVSGHAISESSLEETVREVLTDPQLAAQTQGLSGGVQRRQITRDVLRYLIQVEVTRQYAAERHISVRASEVGTAFSADVQRNGGRARFRQILAQRALTVAQVLANIERNILLTKVERSVLAGSGSSGQQSAAAVFGEWLKERIDRSEVRVNPRFGAFDPSTGGIQPITSTALLHG